MSTMSDLSDEALVQRVIDHNQEEYVHIVERYEQPLLRYAISLVFDYDAARDVVQQSFIKAYTNLRGFDQKRKFSSWLYRIVHNEAVDYLRSQRKQAHPDDEWWQKLPGEEIDIAAVIDTKASVDKLAQLITQLDGKYREPLLLSAFDHKSYQQISDILRIPVSTVGVRINRAKQQLKDMAGNHE
jgi:RNA polymerase sigma-70 factor (ECF subfamily)